MLQQNLDEEKALRYGHKAPRERLRYRELRLAYEELIEKFRALDQKFKDSDEKKRIRALEQAMATVKGMILELQDRLDELSH